MPLLHARVGFNDRRVRIVQTPIRTSPARLNHGSHKHQSQTPGSLKLSVSRWTYWRKDACIKRSPYKERPFLWNVEHSIYKNRTRRCEALIECEEILRSEIPAISADEIKRKRLCLRAADRKEMRCWLFLLSMHSLWTKTFFNNEYYFKRFCVNVSRAYDKSKYV